jgi:hypothetical protein
MGEGEVYQSHEIHYRKDNGTCGGMFPDKLVQQETRRADYYQRKSAYY